MDIRYKLLIELRDKTVDLEEAIEENDELLIEEIIEECKSILYSMEEAY